MTEQKQCYSSVLHEAVSFCRECGDASVKQLLELQEKYHKLQLENVELKERIAQAIDALIGIDPMCTKAINILEGNNEL